jgi:hypothetical protein
MSDKKGTYSALLKLGEDAIDALKHPIQVKKAKNSLQKELIQMEEEIGDLSLKISDAESQYPFDIKAILKAEDEKALKERELEQATAVMARLFPD